jgi:hypothetical protein
MKRILLFVGIILMSYTVSAQSQKSTLPQLTEIEDGLYEVTFTSDSETVTQTGYYKISDNKLVKEGIWKIHNGDKVISKAKFENDDLVWIKTNGIVHTSEEIEILQLRNRIKTLESSLVMRD